MLRCFVLCLVLSVTRATITDHVVDFITRHVQNETCKHHTLHVLHAFNNLELWAVQMVDASAKLQAGILDGNLKNLGHYDQCVGSRDHLVTAQYCLVNVHVTPRGRAPARTTDLLMHLTMQRYGREFIGNRSKAHVPDVNPFLSTIQLGVCVPETCDTQDVAESVRGALQLFLNSAQLDVEVYLSSDTCFIKQPPKPWTLGQIVIGTLVTIMSLLCIIGTFSDSKTPSEGRMNDFLHCFSMKRSWHNLIKTTPNTANSITCLDGIRVFNTCWVIFGHKILFRFMEPVANNASAHYEITSSILRMPISHASLCVDSFLMISGMLKAYQSLNSMDKGKLNSSKDLFRRFLRLSPAYYFMILFYATVLSNLSNGPAWDKFVEKPSKACSTNWFWNLIYSNNYINGDNMCMVQSWYLAVDMQLHLIAPIFLYIIWYFARNAITILVTTLTLATLIPFYVIFVNELPGLPLINSSDEEIVTLTANVYFLTHTRAAAFIIGIGLGYILYKTQNKQLNLNKIFVAVGWLLSILLSNLVLFGAFPLIQFDHKYNAFESALFCAIHRPLWALALAWTVFACHKGYGGAINRILSSTVFQPFSRLAYCVYLTHLTVIMIGSGSARSPKFIGDITLIHDYCGDICFSLVLALILHLLVEAPCSHLTSLYFNQKSSKKPQAAVSENKNLSAASEKSETPSIFASFFEWTNKNISAIYKSMTNISPFQPQKKYN